MSAIQYLEPVRAKDGDGVIARGVLYVENLNVVLPIYADPESTIPLDNPLIADSAGWFPPIYTPESIDEVLEDVALTLIDPLGDIVYEDATPVAARPFTLGDTIPLDNNGDVMQGATRSMYYAGTTQLAPIYEDSSLTGQLANPQTADDDGEFPETWLDDVHAHRCVLRTGKGVQLYDIDNLYLAPHIVLTAPVLSGALNGDEDAIDLSWTEATSNLSEIIGYRLYNAATDALIVDQAGRTYEFSPVSLGNTYSFYVVGYDDRGNVTAHSNTVLIDTDTPETIVDIYTSSSTWTKRPGLVSVDVVVMGAGGGGGSGNNMSAGSYRAGGTGGGGGGRSAGTILAGALASTVAVTVGAGGAGGIGVAYGDPTPSEGRKGTAGGDSSFGTHVTAGGGGRGGGGNNYLPPDSVGGSGNVGNGGTGGLWAPEDSPAVQPSPSNYGGGGGGGGGNREADGTQPPAAGGNGAALGENNAGGTIGAGGGDPGGPGTSSATYQGGGGGAGGRAELFGAAADGGIGGAGGLRGGGGGGGGPTTYKTGAVSGPGGAGAGGVVIVTNYFS